MQERGSWGFGIARSHAIAAAQARMRELCDLLSEATGTVFYPHHALSYRELSESLEHGDLGLGWMPPIPAVELEDRHVATPLALPSRRSNTSYHAAFIARRGGPKALAELQGRRAAWVDRESAAGYLVPRIHLASLGFDVRAFFAQETFVKSHLGVVDAVCTGIADVGATFCSLDPITKRVITAGWTGPDGSIIRPVEVVTTIGPIPNDAIVAAARVPAAVKAAVTRFFLNADTRTRELLTELFHTQSMKVASAAHYEPLRHMLRAARARGYDAHALRSSIFPTE